MIFTPPALLKKIWHWLHKLEDALLMLIFSGMLLAAVTQILLRNLFNTGLGWSDVFLRTAVLWIALIGAMIASRKGDHVQIDILKFFLPPRGQLWCARLAHAGTAVIAVIFCWYGASFVQMEYEGQAIAFGIVPSWLVVAIIPFGFAMIGMRYLILLAKTWEPEA